MFENYRVFETELAGRPFRVEHGKMAGLANAAVMCRYGDTAVLCTATMSPKPREGIDYSPLSVDYEEKLYAVGHIPGSFLRREGRGTKGQRHHGDQKQCQSFLHRKSLLHRIMKMVSGI